MSPLQSPVHEEGRITARQSGHSLEVGGCRLAGGEVSGYQWGKQLTRGQEISIQKRFGED